jgi:hypothetical protein
LNSFEKHREHVQLIIMKLQEVSFHLKLLKYNFKMQQISFVKYIVMLEGDEIELDRVP